MSTTSAYFVNTLTNFKTTHDITKYKTLNPRLS